MLPEFHLTEDTFTLKLLLKRAERLIDVVIANLYLHWFSPPFLCVCFEISQERAM